MFSVQTKTGIMRDTATTDINQLLRGRERERERKEESERKVRVREREERAQLEEGKSQQ